MERDARTLAPGVEVDTDLCIVGAGPAGLSVASEFIGSELDVTVLESGAHQREPDLQTLNEGAVLGGPYDGLQATRHRQVGGTTNIWNTQVNGRTGGKFVPLDPHDLARGGSPLHEWPFDYHELTPYYARAQKFCGLGAFAYDAESWQNELGPAPVLGAQLTSRIYQFGTTEAFAQQYRALRSAGNMRVLLHASACSLAADQGKRRITVVHATTDDGQRFRIRARRVVLAAGAIENARLLLLSRDVLALGESEAWVGQCFMEHPRATGLSLAASPERLGFFGRRIGPGGVVVGGRLGISEQARLEYRIPSASVSLLPPIENGPRGLRGLMARLRPISPETAGPWRVVVNLEQEPHRENRIVLGQARDRFGLPQPVLHWRWRDDEQAGLERLLLQLTNWLAPLGAVTLVNQPVDPNAHHHAGTTRMHDNPSLGVVNSSAQVHGMDNLFIAGASTFPTSAWANPTLTIVALGLRLADRLKAEA